MGYKRVLLKISGEALFGPEKNGIDGRALLSLADKLIELKKAGYEIGVVLGGGNIFRGIRQEHGLTIDRSRADQMGMLATIINGLALLSTLKSKGCPTKIFSSISCAGVVELFDIDKVSAAFASGDLVLFVGGTGHPYFTTDTAAALRASQISADIFLKATTHVDGIYDRDPLSDKGAKKYDRIKFSEVLEKKLGALDLTAVTLCQTNNIPIRVFNIWKVVSLIEAVQDKALGTLVTGD